MATSMHHQNLVMIKHFLLSGFSDQLDVLDTCVAERVVCHNFPEFNPESREEFKAFFRYMADAINPLQLRIVHISADEATVKVHFHISGVHHEEFMGFPASGKRIDFHGMAIYRVEREMIVEVWMYSGEVVFSANKFDRFDRFSTRQRPKYSGLGADLSRDNIALCHAVISA